MQSINAYCSVAIVQTGAHHRQIAAGSLLYKTNRTTTQSYTEPQWDRLRNAPVLLIDRRLNSWIRRDPDVHVQSVATHGGARRPLQRHGDSVQLAGRR